MKKLINPKVSVIINCFSHMECSSEKKFPYFSYCEPLGMESVKNQKYKNKEIILANKKVLNGGAGEIRNDAIKRSKGEILFFLDADAIMVGKDYISEIVKIFEKVDTDVIIAGSIPNKKLSTFFQYLLALEYEDRENAMGEGYIDAGATTYLAIKRNVLKEIGWIPLKSSSIGTKNLFFDTGFLDWDLCGMLKEKGYKIWHTNKVRVYHVMQTDFISYFKKQFIQAWYRIAYYKKFKKIKEGYSKFNFFYPNVFKYYKKTRDIKVFLFIPIFFLRDIIWVLGFIKGVWDFYIRGNYLPK